MNGGDEPGEPDDEFVNRRAAALHEEAARLAEHEQALDRWTEKLDARDEKLRNLSRKAADLLGLIVKSQQETARRLLRLDDRLAEIENAHPGLVGDLPSCRVEVMAENRRLVDHAENVQEIAAIFASEPDSEPEERTGSAPVESEAEQKTTQAKSPPVIPYDDSLRLRLTVWFCLTMGGGGLIGLATWLIPMPATLVHLAEPFGRGLMEIGVGVAIVHDMLRRLAKRARR